MSNKISVAFGIIAIGSVMFLWGISTTEQTEKKKEQRVKHERKVFQRGSEFHPSIEKWGHLLEDSDYIPVDFFGSRPGDLEEARTVEFVFLKRHKDVTDDLYEYRRCTVKEGDILTGDDRKHFGVGFEELQKYPFRFRFQLAPNESERKELDISASRFEGLTVLESNTEYTLSYRVIRAVGSEILGDSLFPKAFSRANEVEGIRVMGTVWFENNYYFMVDHEITFKTPKYRELKPGEVRYFPIVVEYKLDDFILNE